MMTKFTCCLALTASLAFATQQSYDDQHNALQALLLDSHSHDDQTHESSDQTYDQAPIEPVYEDWKNFDMLDTDAYQNRVLNDQDNAWVIAFVSPSCGSCHTLAQKWEGVQQHGAPDHNVKYGYVNTSTQAGKEILRNYTGDVNIQYTPTILVYGSDKNKPEEYHGGYDNSDEINHYVCDYCDNNGFTQQGIKPETQKEHVAEDTYGQTHDDYQLENITFDQKELDLGSVANFKIDAMTTGFDDFVLGGED